jgi:hypothetical protein
MKNTFVLLILLLMVFPYPGSSQDSFNTEPVYEVNRVLPAISLTKEKLAEATTLIDLNKKYPSSWVREYLSVEIITTEKGKTRNAVSENDTLSQEQKDNMRTADSGTDFSVIVRYIPENTLKQNDAKDMEFRVSVDPDQEASFPGGPQQLEQYLNEEVNQKIQDSIFTGYKLAAVKFTINEEGQVIDAHVFWTSEDEKVDAIMLDAICSMPNWKPAEYSDGTKVKQEFAFTVGNMESCVLPLLNIKELKPFD